MFLLPVMLGLITFAVAELNWISLPHDKIPSFPSAQKADQTLSAIAWSQCLVENSREEIWQEEEKRIIPFCDVPGAG